MKPLGFMAPPGDKPKVFANKNGMWMSIAKYVYRLKRMDLLIRKKATGAPEQFAGRLGLSRRTLLTNLRELRQMGCGISFCQLRQSYVYDDDQPPLFRFLDKI